MDLNSVRFIRTLVSFRPYKNTKSSTRTQLVNRDVSTLLPDVTFIHEVRVNSSGNSVAFLATDQSGNEDGRVYIYSPERQKIQIHDTRHVLSRLSDNDGTLSSTSFPRGSSASPNLSDVADSGSIQFRVSFLHGYSKRLKF